MTPYQAYNVYVRLKTHFNKEQYDFFKYVGQEISYKAYESRNDKHLFWKATKQYKTIPEWTTLIVSNYIWNPGLWIGDLLERQCENRYILYKRREQSRTYTTKQELDELSKEWLLIKNGQNPIILERYYANELGLDTLIICNKYINGLFDYFDRKLSDRFIWPKRKFLAIKYEPFVRYDPDSCRKIILDKLNQK